MISHRSVSFARAFVLSFVGCAGACGVSNEASKDDTSKDDALGSSGTAAGSTDTEVSTDTGGSGAMLVEVEDIGPFPYCGAAPAHLGDDTDWLFGAKYRLEFTPGTYSVESGARIPYQLEVRGQVRGVTPMADGPMQDFSVGPGRWIPVEFGGEVDGDPAYRTLEFLEWFELDEPIVDSWLGDEPIVESALYVALSARADDLEASSDTFIIGPKSPVYVHAGSLGLVGACERDDLEPDLMTVVLDAGEVVFESRAIDGAAGLPLRASGEIDGIAFDVADYFRLAYSNYGLTYFSDPMFGVQLDEPGPGGECALYIFVRNSPDAPTSEAWWLDCQGNHLRELAVIEATYVLGEP